MICRREWKFATLRAASRVLRVIRMSAPTGESLKGPGEREEEYDGAGLRILIVHARWNTAIISPLVQGCIETLLAAGVQRSNIVIETVPGSYELPVACSRSVVPISQPLPAAPRLTNDHSLIAASQIQASATASDLMGATLDLAPTPTRRAPFNAAIAIGCLIKGSTSHYEYISDAVTHGLMRVQLDTGIPVIYGVLNCLTEEQALQRAGVGKDEPGHNHGIDWGNAAVELALKTVRWAQGEI